MSQYIRRVKETQGGITISSLITLFPL